uniref:snRNA-activating protein complex subunit 3 n=1 Tax=Amblyomma maculatum TaxID=34609 RepID=G3MT08_AMBMU
MDAIHEPDDRDWIGEPLKVADFSEEWTHALQASGCGEYDDKDVGEAIMKALNISESALRSLEEDFRMSSLCCGEENLDTTKLPEKTELETLKLLKEDLHEREKDLAYRYKYTQFMRKSCPFLKMNLVGEHTQEKFPETEAVPSGEAVLIVQVFKPVKTPTFKKVRFAYHTYPFRVLSEVAVLGCQTLRDLREKIHCVTDDTSIGDFSDNPDKPQELPASEVYKSGFFYIGDTFYNDMTDPSCRDYSEVIINWAKNPRRGLGPFKKALMEETKFNQLEIRLGYPYVYVHLGNCEHLIVFSNLRMHHIHDSQHLLDYPFVEKCFPVGKRVFCMLCRKNTAKWVTTENERVTEDPFFFCAVCFRKFNYTADNKKIGNFQAFPYLDWNAVM